jgi:ABC-type multidrug transport system ATPase subunit
VTAVHEDLTVRENLVCSARLRLSASKTADDKAGLVEDAIELLQVCGAGRDRQPGMRV